MKRLTDLTEVSTEDLPSVYCDMDMVLCNFMKKADEVSGGDFCTYCDEGRFYSYRRDSQCGRMLSMIYKKNL